MRKIIQIACAVAEATGSLGRERLFALCDDGTLFGMKPPDGKGRRGWEEIEPVPQPPQQKLVPGLRVWIPLDADGIPEGTSLSIYRPTDHNMKEFNFREFLMVPNG